MHSCAIFADSRVHKALDRSRGPPFEAEIPPFWREQRFTALLVTHDVAEAVTLADRVVLIEDGEIAHDVVVDLPRPRQRGSAEWRPSKGGYCASCSAARARSSET